MDTKRVHSIRNKIEQSINKGLVIYDIPEGTTVDWSNPDG